MHLHNIYYEGRYYNKCNEVTPVEFCGRRKSSKKPGNTRQGDVNFSIEL